MSSDSTPDCKYKILMVDSTNMRSIRDGVFNNVEDCFVGTIKAFVGKNSYFFLKNGLLHREDGPALISHKKRTNSYLEMYFINGVNHRLTHEGPAIISHDTSSLDFYDLRVNSSLPPKKETYVEHGLSHREDGPANITRGSFLDELTFCLNGKVFTKEEYQLEINKLNLKKKLNKL